MLLTTTFPCGHPRTPENTKPRSDRPGGACRTCRRVIEARAQKKRRDGNR